MGESRMGNSHMKGTGDSRMGESRGNSRGNSHMKNTGDSRMGDSRMGESQMGDADNKMMTVSFYKNISYSVNRSQHQQQTTFNKGPFNRNHQVNGSDEAQCSMLDEDIKRQYREDLMLEKQ